MRLSPIRVIRGSDAATSSSNDTLIEQLFERMRKQRDNILLRVYYLDCGRVAISKNEERISSEKNRFNG